MLSRPPRAAVLALALSASVGAASCSNDQPQVGAASASTSPQLSVSASAGVTPSLAESSPVSPPPSDASSAASPSGSTSASGAPESASPGASPSGPAPDVPAGYKAVESTEFDLSVPAAWKQLDLSAADVEKAVKDLDVSESFKRELLKTRTSSPSAGVFFVFDPMSAGSSSKRFTTNANIVKVPSSGASTDTLERVARQAAKLLDGRDLTVKRRTLADGREVVVTTYLATKFKYPLTQRQYYAPGAAAVYILTLTTDRAKAYSAAFDTIGGSFRPR